MTINEIQDEIIEEFAGFDDWMDKYQLLIDLGNEQEPLEDKYKTEQNLIDGCQSRVWLVAEFVKETGVRRQETGDRRQESGDRRQESGDRSQESGVRRQETGDRSDSLPG